jgi:DNA gyrase subunit A
MAITASGMIIRTSVEGLRVLGRDTQGVRMIRLGPGDRVVDVVQVVAEAAGTASGPPAALAESDAGDGAGEGDGDGARSGKRGGRGRAKMQGDEEDEPDFFEEE